MTTKPRQGCDPEMRAQLTQMSSSLADATANLAAAAHDIRTISKRLEQIHIAMSGEHPAQVAEAMLRRDALLLQARHDSGCECADCWQAMEAGGGRG